MYQKLDRDIASVITQAADPEEGLFVSLCTIQAPDETLGESGQPDLKIEDYADVPGLVDLVAMSAPISPSRIQAVEVKDLVEIMATQLRHVLLVGYYPQIAEHTNWLALIRHQDEDESLAVAWDILGAEADSTPQMTRLEVKRSSL